MARNSVLQTKRSTTTNTLTPPDAPHATRPRVKSAPILWRVKNFRYYAPGALNAFAAERLARLTNVPVLISTLRVRLLFDDGRIIDYGVVSKRVVTTAGVNYLVDCLQNNQEPENLKYHGYGTGTNAEAVGDTALQTELTTQYATDNTRPTGSLGVGAS